MNKENYKIFVWSIFALSITMPFIAWAANLNWKFDILLNPLLLFPLFGLLAWMTMWTHYVNGAIRLSKPELQTPRYYSKATGWFVLGSLLLHPGIFAIELWQNGAGFPPTSYFDYVGMGLQFAVILGMIGLTIFLSFELFDRIQNKPLIKKWWPAVSISQSLAMILVFVHGLRLGGVLADGWFRWVWLAYGLALIPCFYIIHRADFTKE